MVPPNTGGQVQVDAPLSKWRVLSAQDTAQDCEEMRTDLFKEGEADAKGDRTNRVLRQLIASQCIATDDPRLAK